MYKKIIISILLIFNIVFLNISSCFASNVSGSDWNYFIDKFENLQSLNDLIDLMHRGSFGLIPSSSDFNKNNEAWDELNQWITGRLNDQGNEEPTEEDKVEELKSHITINDNSVVTDTELNQEIINILNNYADQNQAYIYTYDIAKYPNLVTDTGTYLALTKLMANGESFSDFVYCARITNGICQIAVISYKDFPYLYVRKFPLLSNEDGTRLLGGRIFDGSNNLAVSGNPTTNTDLKFSYLTYKATLNDGQGGFDNYNASFGGITYKGLKNPDLFATPSGNDRYMFLSYRKTDKIRYFDGTPTAQDLLYQPYYYNNDVWQDFSTSSGDYSFSPSNINTVTYGDVTSYIDNSNTENGYPPSPTDIDIHIEDKDEENKDTSSGGGSGSGGDDSGGSGGGIGSVGDIFGWLKQLGSVIASLIKGIGEFITEVVTGLVAAITDLLSGIGDLITSITETLPQTFMEWFGSLFEWMPTEWKALLSASLVFMVLWGIIKLIRG